VLTLVIVDRLTIPHSLQRQREVEVPGLAVAEPGEHAQTRRLARRHFDGCRHELDDEPLPLRRVECDLGIEGGSKLVIGPLDKGVGSALVAGRGLWLRHHGPLDSRSVCRAVLRGTPASRAGSSLVGRVASSVDCQEHNLPGLRDCQRTWAL
jgi:hypothetical protein